MKKLLIATVGALLALGTVDTAQAATIVVPNSLAAREGNTNNSFPFNTGPSRYQQVYAASEFASSAEPELIAQILFRPDAVFGNAFSSTLPNIQINLSTTSVAPDGLSMTFANNVGSNDTVVFTGPLSLSSGDTGPIEGPKDFDIVINLSTPFLYDKSAGNLLLDIRNFVEGSATTPFDSENSLGDPISRVYAVSFSNVNSPTGVTDSFGLVTKFVTIPPSQAVPEPASALGMLAFGAFGVGSQVLRRQKSNYSAVNLK